MATTEKRSVHTDALQTLGTVIWAGEKRDAIHLAVEPVQADQHLVPGQPVRRHANGRWGTPYVGGDPLGIVDPFLSREVAPGEWFWLLLYPRQITSLRHVWEHPDFPSGDTPPAPLAPVMASEAWIRKFANSFEAAYDCPPLSYEELMEYAQAWEEKGEMGCLGSEEYQDHYSEFPEFWKHYAAVTGKEIPEEKRGCFFRCAC